MLLRAEGAGKWRGEARDLGGVRLVGPLGQRAAHKWPSFSRTLLLKTNASFFFFFSLGKPELC